MAPARLARWVSKPSIAMLLALMSPLALVAAGSSPLHSHDPAAETARWMTHSNSWGYLTTLSGGKPSSAVFSISDGVGSGVGSGVGRLMAVESAVESTQCETWKTMADAQPYCDAPDAHTPWAVNLTSVFGPKCTAGVSALSCCYVPLSWDGGPSFGTPCGTACAAQDRDGSDGAYCQKSDHSDYGSCFCGPALPPKVNGSTGRLWFYITPLMAEDNGAGYAATLTLSQTGINNTCWTSGSNVDPEDPRCAKASFTGTMKQSTGADVATGKAALFARHPQMAKWPAGHAFAVHELVLDDIWLIYFFGGGAKVTPAAYFAAKPHHSVPSWPPSGGGGGGGGRDGRALSRAAPGVAGTPPPPHNETAKRARWLVYHSTWTSVGTVSVMYNGKPWGNVRSIADGVGPNSTGLPVLYVPTPDPTAVDLRANPHCTLSFSDASLPLRQTAAPNSCGGFDAEDPTCARLHMHATLTALTTKAEIAQAEVNLGARHPLAPWLAGGGAHTGGKYYKVHPTELVFLDYYGGPAKLTVAEYLAAKPI